MNIDEEVRVVRDAAIKLAFEKSDVRPALPRSLFVDAVAKADRSVLKATLGEDADVIAHCLLDLNSTHPDFHSVLSEKDDAYLRDALKIAAYAVDNKMSEFIPAVAKIVGRAKKNVIRKLSPNHCIRFLPEKDRIMSRSLRAVQSVSLRVFQKNGDLIWKELPTSFLMYVRHNKVRQDEIERSQKKYEQFKKMRCESLCEEIAIYIKNLKSYTTAEYCGFHRLPLTLAAMLLAKLHGARVEYAYGDQPLRLPSSVFDKYKFDCDGMLSTYVYAPRLYPFHGFSSIASGRIVDLVKHLDALPELSGHPAFDNYLVLVPTVEFASGSFFLPDGTVQRSKTVSDLQKKFDMEMVKQGVFRPVLLGERDNICYFISYWENNCHPQPIVPPKRLAEQDIPF